jgi:hypothetical protein
VHTPGRLTPQLPAGWRHHPRGSHNASPQMAHFGVDTRRPPETAVTQQRKPCRSPPPGHTQIFRAALGTRRQSTSCRGHATSIQSDDAVAPCSSVRVLSQPESSLGPSREGRETQWAPRLPKCNLLVAKIFLVTVSKEQTFLHVVQTGFGSSQWVPGALSPGGGEKMNTDLRLVQRSRKRGYVHSFPSYASTTCSRIDLLLHSTFIHLLPLALSRQNFF